MIKTKYSSETNSKEFKQTESITILCELYLITYGKLKWYNIKAEMSIAFACDFPNRWTFNLNLYGDLSGVGSL